MKNKYDLIIFDCDGTLVNTEHISNEVHSKLLTDFGLPEYTAEMCDKLFTGNSWSKIKKDLEEKHNLEIPESIFQDYVAEMLVRVETDLIPISGALDLIERLSQKVKIAVGSNGMRDNVLKSLKVSGYLDFFEEGAVFTRIQVKNPKPAPDLFLFAAETMEVAPERTLVIEDSPTGVKAGIAAGMNVFGFTGTAHAPADQKEKLLNAGATQVFNEFIHISETLGY